MPGTRSRSWTATPVSFARCCEVAGVPAVQRSRRAQGPRRMAPGVLGIEHQAHGGAGGMLTQPMALRGVDLVELARRPNAIHTPSRVPGAGLPLRTMENPNPSVRSTGRLPYGHKPFARRENFCGAHSHAHLAWSLPWWLSRKDQLQGRECFDFVHLRVTETDTSVPRVGGGLVRVPKSGVCAKETILKRNSRLDEIWLVATGGLEPPTSAL